MFNAKQPEMQQPMLANTDQSNQLSNDRYSMNYSGLNEDTKKVSASQGSNSHQSLIKRSSSKILRDSKYHEIRQDHRVVLMRNDSNDVDFIHNNKSYRGNKVRTSKYTMWSFLPKNLLLQLTKSANLYFLIISFLQMVDSITTTNGKPTQSGPLIVVVLVSMIKDAYEDYKKAQRDKEENVGNTAEVCNHLTKKWESFTKWQNIRVGDLVKVNRNQYMPCDIAVLHSSGNGGVYYVETKELDGETNLKLKSVDPDIQHEYAKSHIKIVADIQCDKPNANLYKFQGRIDLSDSEELQYSKARVGKQIPLDTDSLVLRGMSLRNTDAIIGVAIYTGHETKILMNSAEARYKKSRLDRFTDSSVKWLFAIQLLATFILGCVAIFPITAQWDKAYYLYDMKGRDENDKPNFSTVIRIMGTWILLFVNLVPISLMISMDIVRIIQGNFMQMDVLMYDQAEDLPMRCAASNLNEEIGQIDYVFSDKTGTLTQNVMLFKKFTAGQSTYGTNTSPTEHQLPNVHFFDVGFEEAQHSGTKEQKEEIQRVMTFMSLCHSIVVDKQKNEYNASSPDELALVNFAKQVGYEYIDKDEQGTVTIGLNNKENPQKNTVLKYKLLDICDFTSTRKRMSCIYQTPEGKIILMCKGADSVIEKRLNTKSKESKTFQITKSKVTGYANEGLRTLYLAEKQLTQQEYETWQEKKKQARLADVNREDEISAVDEQIETDLELIGSTAIEDKLQDQVADTITFMKEAGIRVWVLTGDKVETAVNIGFSAGLLDTSIQQHYIDETTEDGLIRQIGDISKEIIHTENKKHAMIVSGESFTIILDKEFGGPESLRSIFTEASQKVDVLLACRVSPRQKSQIVMLIRNQYPMKNTLSIGDGANDCPMILKAHVGVGILGKEGQQAARSADYAIGQFKFLKPLLFIHGREAYRRNSMVFLYSFYKNFLYIITLFYFGFDSAFTGQIIYEVFFYLQFNFTMTSLPIMFYAVLDREYEKQPPKEGQSGQLSKTKYFMNNPELYKIGLNDECISGLIFAYWIALGMIQSFFCYLLGMVVLNSPGFTSPEGHGNGLWMAGQIAFGLSVMIANVVIFMKFYVHHWLSLVSIILMFLAYFVAFVFESNFFFFIQIYLVFPQAFSQVTVWIIFLFIVMVTSAYEFGIKLNKQFDN